MPEPTYSAEEVDAAVQRLTEPDRLRHAQDVVTHAAPALERVLDQALDEGGWFGPAHDAQLTEAALEEQPDERLRRLRTMIDEETRLGMLVGVAVGFELAHELAAQRDER